MAGFDNDVVYGTNVDFSGGSPVSAQISTNGQLLIGTTSVNAGGTHINVGSLTSPAASITIGFSSPNITLEAGASIPTTFQADSGTAIPALNILRVLGAATAAGTNPVFTTGSGNTLMIDVQRSQAIAAANATKIGLAAFDSARFSVDVNGFVTINGAGVGETITGDSGGALNPSSGNWNILGLSGSKTSGSGS